MSKSHWAGFSGGAIDLLDPASFSGGGNKIIDGQYSYEYFPQKCGFMEEAEPIFAVPKYKYIYLNKDFLEFCGGDQRLEQLAYRLYDESGIVYLGEVIKLGRKTILESLGGCSEPLSKLEARLSEYNLGLNARAPGWHRPDLFRSPRGL
jgi:hypothetical protein